MRKRLKMKKIVLTLLVLVLACQMMAQQRKDEKRKEAIAIGIRAGANRPSYNYPDNPGLDTLGFAVFKDRIAAPVLGINVEFPLLGGHVYVAPEVALARRGDTRLFESTTLDTLVCYKARVNYLEARLPVSVAVPVTKWLKPYVFAAPSFSLALPTVGPFTSEITQYSLDQAKTLDQTVAVDSSNMAPYDFGVLLGGGLRFTIDFKSFLMVVKVEGGYHLGFLDTYSAQEHKDQAQAVNVNAYNINGKRLNRGIEGAITIAIPLSFPGDDCFYWSDVVKKKNKNRGFYGF